MAVMIKTLYKINKKFGIFIIILAIILLCIDMLAIAKIGNIDNENNNKKPAQAYISKNNISK